MLQATAPASPGLLPWLAADVAPCAAGFCAPAAPATAAAATTPDEVGSRPQAQAHAFARPHGGARQRSHRCRRTSPRCLRCCCTLCCCCRRNRPPPRRRARRAARPPSAAAWRRRSGSTAPPAGPPAAVATALGTPRETSSPGTRTAASGTQPHRRSSTANRRSPRSRRCSRCSHRSCRRCSCRGRRRPRRSARRRRRRGGGQLPSGAG
eukprot:191614-Chlamydomonas_euryale.AAC.2